jgi:hypothetical protein
MKKRPFVPGIVPFFVFFTPPVQKGQFSSCNMDFTTLCLNLQPVSHKKQPPPGNKGAAAFGASSFLPCSWNARNQSPWDTAFAACPGCFTEQPPGLTG